MDEEPELVARLLQDQLRHPADVRTEQDSSRENVLKRRTRHSRSFPMTPSARALQGCSVRPSARPPAP